MEVVASLSQGRTAAAQCGLFTHKSVPVIIEPPYMSQCVCEKHSMSQTPRKIRSKTLVRGWFCQYVCNKHIDIETRQLLL